MDMDRIACYRAISTRDARFDGRLFVGVKTTGIYCRPICPARTPKFANVSFYASAAAAQQAGFRPCLRCRPEISPELAFWRGTSNTVSRALSLIEAGGLDDDDVEGLADRLGVGGRQLRRLFRQHVGAPPVAVAQTRRVLLAKQLIHETRLPMAEVGQLWVDDAGIAAGRAEMQVEFALAVPQQDHAAANTGRPADRQLPGMREIFVSGAVRPYLWP